VAVLEGSVQVRGRSILPDAQVRTLEAGQRVTTTNARIGPIPTSLASVGAIETASSAAGAWRSGQLTYDDTRLADLVADLNRYYRPGVTLEPGALADTRLAASFKVGEIDKFLAELPTVAPVEVTRGADGAVIIGPRTGDGPQA
jgi:transmembrane sensor